MWWPEYPTACRWRRRYTVVCTEIRRSPTGDLFNYPRVSIPKFGLGVGNTIANTTSFLIRKWREVAGMDRMSKLWPSNCDRLFEVFIKDIKLIFMLLYLNLEGILDNHLSQEVVSTQYQHHPNSLYLYRVVNTNQHRISNCDPCLDCLWTLGRLFRVWRRSRLRHSSCSCTPHTQLSMM